MNEFIFLFEDCAVQECRKCLLQDFHGAIPKRLSEVAEDIEHGEEAELQCDDCQLSQQHFTQFVIALCAGAALGDEMGDI